MAQITITIPDNILPRVLNGFASNHGYSPIVENGAPNPETKVQFCRRKLIEYIKQSIRNAEMEEARNTAAETAAESVDTDIVLT